MDKCPKVTVLMPVYNGESYLNEAVNSILAQTFTDFEYLIIDDASSDGTPDILRHYTDPRIKIVTNEKNLGLTKSLNKGLAMARGKYIARMDADDISLPGRFERQVAVLDSQPDIALVGTSYQLIDTQGNVLREKILPKEIYYDHHLKKGIIPYTNVIHSSVMVRHDIMDEFSGYNELFKKSQDFALWLQMSKKYRLRNLPDILVKVRDHPDRIGKTGNEQIYYQILAVRMAENPLPKELTEEILASGISNLYRHFTKSERVYYHRIMATRLHANGEQKQARQECWKSLKLRPFDRYNLLIAIQLLLGRRSTNKVSKIYCNLQCFIHRSRLKV